MKFYQCESCNKIIVTKEYADTEEEQQRRRTKPVCCLTRKHCHKE